MFHLEENSIAFSYGKIILLLSIPPFFFFGFASEPNSLINITVWDFTDYISVIYYSHYRSVQFPYSGFIY